MQNLFLITLKEAIQEYQGKKRKEFESRGERNSFKAIHFLSTQILGHGDETTVWKFLNPSTSKVKFGVEEFAKICIEIENVSAIEDFLEEVKEKIEIKKDHKRQMLKEQLKSLEV